ncbi:alpha-amylase family glycosyl hydrolase [Paraglaciecola sp.]|uniref:alpha-amylase family glycosyl hydrolase n=1 Tax=Paraglaciecola sp. TaxID=1920173 RepID=UPI002740081D|nr:alpha-amylase family glycosyl hydrolase [Paraglaciecola sp.]MDP5032591.1 alpha-amylase family glycosyl hydrolase [Paraglaciecola sp.]
MNKQMILGLSISLLLSGCFGGSSSDNGSTEPQVPPTTPTLPVTPPVSPSDDERFMDTDQDGIADSQDNCPQTASGNQVDTMGCFKALHIEAEDYIDAFDLTEGNAGQAYKSGDVDIYRARDVDGGHAVGANQVSEWQSYNLSLPGGYYEIHSRIASENGTGGYSIYLNDQLIVADKVTLPTGDAYSWSTRRLGKFSLEQGDYTLQVVTDEAGLSLNWLEFIAVGPTVSCDNGKPQEGVFECEVTPLTETIENQDRVLYEMNYSTLGREDALQKVVTQLDHLQSLKVNTLWLMPLHPRGSSEQVSFNINYLLPAREYGLSPYAVADYLSIDQNLGDMNDLRMLINEAHKRGISVILDWVANHTGWNHPWLLNKAWYTQVDGIVVNPQEQPWFDVADLNYDNMAMRAAMIDSMMYWIEQGVDGFRCDYADGVPDDFWQAAITQIRQIKPDALMLAEGSVKHLSLGFDLTFSWDANTSVKHAIEEADASLVVTQQELQNSTYNLPENTHLLRYSTNHDLTAWEENPIQIACVQIAEDCAAYSELAQQGGLAQFALNLLYGDVPLIYSGQEVGEDKNTSFYVDDLIDWTKNADILQQYQALMTFFSGSDLVKKGSEKPYPNDTVVAFQKVYQEQRFVMLSNVLKTPNNYAVPEALQGEYHNALSGETVSLGSSYVLAPFEYLLLSQDYVATGPAYGDTQLYLRSDFNGWSLDNPMIYVGDNTYIGAANVTSTGNFYFKFANAEWNFRIGTEGLVGLDQAIPLSLLTDAYDPAPTIQIDDTGWYVFTLNTQDPNAPILTITKEQPTYPGVTLFLRGFDGIWDESRPMTYYGSGYYAFDILASQNEDLSFNKYFKIASASWSNPNSGGAAVILDGDYVSVQQVDDAISLALSAETQLRIIYYASDDSANLGEVSVLSLPLP